MVLAPRAYGTQTPAGRERGETRWNEWRGEGRLGGGREKQNPVNLLQAKLLIGVVELPSGRVRRSGARGRE